MNGSDFLRNTIREAQGQKFKTLSELAERAKVNQGNLSSFMKPDGDPRCRESMTFDSAWKILHALGLSLEFGCRAEESMDVPSSCKTANIMKTQDKIKQLFENVLQKNKGNKTQAAMSLGTNPVTFWGWITGKRGLNTALCNAIDMAGGVLLLPGEQLGREKPECEACHQMKDEIADLKGQIKAYEKALEIAYGKTANIPQPPTASTCGASGKPEQLLSSLEDVDQKAS